MRWSLRLLLSFALLLDAVVDTGAPGAIGAVEDGDQVTVRQLLNHTSGLYDPQVEVYQTLQGIYDLRFEHWMPRQVMALANDNGLLFPPGTAWSYSNTNYVVANLHPAPDALYAALSAALFEILCGMAPAEASAAARANPGTAGVIRFR